MGSYNAVKQRTAQNPALGPLIAVDPKTNTAISYFPISPLSSKDWRFEPIILSVPRCRNPLLPLLPRHLAFQPPASAEPAEDTRSRASPGTGRIRGTGGNNRNFLRHMVTWRKRRLPQMTSMPQNAWKLFVRGLPKSPSIVVFASVFLLLFGWAGKRSAASLCFCTFSTDRLAPLGTLCIAWPTDCGLTIGFPAVNAAVSLRMASSGNFPSLILLKQSSISSKRRLLLCYQC